ncbi:MAG: MFS transporter [Spirochaetes bacterium]|nr:MFS transporter [Spirochaetota bacterium]
MGNPAAARYAVDGFLVGSATTIASNTHNLFAVRLGANDFQLSLVFFLPQMFNMLVLIPGGLFTDSLHNKKRMVLATLSAAALGYLICSLSPFTAGYSVFFYLVFLSLASGAIALYNVAWQSYFPDVIDREVQNRVLTGRTYVFIFFSMLSPLIVGAVLAFIRNLSGKIIAHQGFFIGSALLFLLAANNFRKFQAVRKNTPKRITLPEIKRAAKGLLHNKPFLLFASAALFFHITWHFDWTLYFIGQVKYLNMNELQLGLVTVGTTAMQLITLKFWSLKNEKYGVVLPFTFGIIGLSLCPVSIAAAVSLPQFIGPYAFLVFHTISHIPFATITLNLFQCLLQVVDEEYRSFSMAVFACLIGLSNAIMPVAGVALYHALGGDLDGFRRTFALIFVLRIIAAGLWLLRWRHLQTSRLAD